MDYKTTIFLPQTDFPMKGDLTSKEPEALSLWDREKIYHKIRQGRKGATPFILHWGPPYANGNLHVGHALNAILKDVVCRTHTLLGYDAPLIPGWDCHGLPIEWKIEEGYRAKGKNKDDVPLLEFRDECRAYASHWIDIQLSEFKRLGVALDDQTYYKTMDFKSESRITKEIFTFLEKGSLYQGFRPIMWSVIEKTALAEAEIEYMDKTSNSIYVRFPIAQTDIDTLKGVDVLIWTTTPWSLPGNRAVAYNPEINYGIYQTPQGNLLIATDLVESVIKTAGIEEYKLMHTLNGADLKNTHVHHPLHNKGYTHDVPLLPAGHVTTDSGTGLVHTAPGHGVEDFEVGKRFNLEVPLTVMEDGLFHQSVPQFAGLHVYKADDPIMENLEAEGKLLHKSKITHSYPHSWRSKKPLIYRATPQWFISMDKTGLRDKALTAISKTKWIPSQGENRISSMIEGRPDWCISRQRAWGVPLKLFVNKATNEVLIDPEVNQRIIDAVTAKGCDVWYTADPDIFLKPKYDMNDYIQVFDIVDVWFESGATQGYVLEDYPNLSRPADLYLEGSDQHRGWFQSSLLVGCGTRGDAPFKAVLTHGFTVDEQGRKMSKSLGNTISLDEVVKTLGAEILRLWVISCDFSDDLRIGKELLKHQQEIYRRYRNSLRYMLGALNGYNKKNTIDYKDLPDLEKWVLHRLHEITTEFKETANSFNFQSFYAKLHTFCSSDLSAFYFDIRKDSLYCDATDSPKRQATLYVMDIIFEHLVHMLLPVLPFTAQEAFQYRRKDSNDLSIHWAHLPETEGIWNNPALGETFQKQRDIRGLLTTALEKARAAGLFGSSLQAKVTLFDPQGHLTFDAATMAEMAIVSNFIHERTQTADVSLLSDEKLNLKVLVEKAEGEKCERCWKILPEVGTLAHATLCQRCNDAVATHEGVARA